MDSKGTIAIVGAGFMGTVIATLCAAHGYKVELIDNNRNAIDRFTERATPIAQQFANTSNSANEILKRINCGASIEEGIRGAFLVHEVIHEDLEAKRALFRQLDSICGHEVMLATNTSSFLLSEICDGIAGRDRVIGIHYVTPAHLIRAVEVVTASFTSEASVRRAREFVSSIDHVAIVCRERPGFLVNRIQYALKAEVQRMVQEGVASVEDIDAVVRLSIGPRLALWGPLMQEDMSASKKTVVAVTEYIHRATGEAHYASTPVLRLLAERGNIGAVSGAGWYRWGANYEQLVRERDHQLGDLLAWLRANDRRDLLGAEGENELLREARAKA
jgi:3-hydroxybutyryl-CoA dehydrogenase